MKKISPLLIIANRYIAFLALLFVIMSSNSCKRIDIVKTPVDLRNSKFFKANKPVSTHINSVIEKLKDFNNKTGFVEKLDDKKGLPVWDKIVFKKNNFRSRGLSDSLEEYIVPVTENDKSLSSLINIKELIDGNFLIENYTANDYLYKKIYEFNPDLEKMEGLLVTFFFMENETFGNKEFFNIPAKYFTNLGIIDINGNQEISIKDVEPSLDNYFTMCTKVHHLCTVCHLESCINTVDVVYCRSYWDGTGGGGGGGLVGGGGTPGGMPGGSGSGLGGSGGSTGGGGTPPPLPPCPGTAFYRGEPAQTIGGAPVCDPNKLSLTIGSIGTNIVNDFPELDNYFEWKNNSIDTLDLNGYPCLKRIYIAMTNSPTFYNTLKNFTGTNPKGNVKFKVDTTNGVPYAASTNSSISQQKSTITFFVSPLSKSTVSFATLTFIHEMIHADFDRILMRMGIDTSLRNTYSKVIQTLGRFKRPELQDHEFMANEYIPFLKSIFTEIDMLLGSGPHTKPGLIPGTIIIDTEYYTALAWSGLQETSAWNSLPQEVRTSYETILSREAYLGAGCN